MTPPQSPESTDPPAPPRRPRWGRLAVAIACVGGVAVLLMVRARRPHDANAAETAPSATAKGPRAVPVLVAPVALRDVPLWMEGLGTVAAWQQVTVRAQVDGRLERVAFREGQLVKKGELLAQIDPRPFDVQLHQAEGAVARDRALLVSNRLNLERYRELRAKNLVSQQQVDDQAGVVGQLEGAVRIDEAAVEAARLNLAYARVVAPMDGVLGVRLVDAGNLVRSTDVNGLVILTQIDPAAIYFTLPEDQLAQVVAAQARGAVPVEAWSRDGTAKLGEGTLVVVDNQINQATATLRLKAKVANPSRALWPNQFVRARLLLGIERGALVVPTPAVQRGPEGAFVYLVRDEEAAAQPVKVGLATGDVTVVQSGLAAGDTVVVEGQAQLRPGAKVIARPAAAGKSDRHK